MISAPGGGSPVRNVINRIMYNIMSMNLLFLYFASSTLFNTLILFKSFSTFTITVIKFMMTEKAKAIILLKLYWWLSNSITSKYQVIIIFGLNELEHISFFECLPKATLQQYQFPATKTKKIIPHRLNINTVTNNQQQKQNNKKIK